MPGIISSLDNDRPLQSGGGAGTAHPCPLVLLGESQTKYLGPQTRLRLNWGGIIGLQMTHRRKLPGNHTVPMRIT